MSSVAASPAAVVAAAERATASTTALNSGGGGGGGNDGDGSGLSEADALLWLQQVLGREDAPTFEVTPGTLSVLAELSSCAQAREAEATILARHAEERAEAYLREGARLDALLLDGVGLDRPAFSSAGAGAARLLAQLAVTLRASDCSLASLLLGSRAHVKQQSALRAETEKARREAQRLSLETSRLEHHVAQLEHLEAVLDEDANALAAAAARRLERIPHLEAKATDYAAAVRLAEMRLADASYGPETTHGAVCDAAARLERAQRERAPLDTALQEYAGLPIDMGAAKVQLAAVVRECARLEAALGLS